jgi:hypothetical protein
MTKAGLAPIHPGAFPKEGLAEIGVTQDRRPARFCPSLPAHRRRNVGASGAVVQRDGVIPLLISRVRKPLFCWDHKVYFHGSI